MVDRPNRLQAGCGSLRRWLVAVMTRSPAVAQGAKSTEGTRIGIHSVSSNCSLMIADLDAHRAPARRASSGSAS